MRIISIISNSDRAVLAECKREEEGTEWNGVGQSGREWNEE